MKNKIYILTGGTINKVSPHFAVSAPAYGLIGEELYELFSNFSKDVILIKTKMADSKFFHPTFIDAGIKSIETNDDLKKFILFLNTQQDVSSIVLSVAVADFKIELPSELINKRLSSSSELIVKLVPSEKILPLIMDGIFTVSFKTLFNEEDTNKAFKNNKESDIVFVNDIGKRKNGLIVNSTLTWFDSRELCSKELSNLIRIQYEKTS